MGNYYSHQHSQSTQDTDTVVLQSSLYDRVGGSGGVDHANGDVKRAVGNQMAAYKAPKRRKQDSHDLGKPLCAEDGCKAFPMKAGDHGFCTGHARSKGLVEAWGHSGRKEKEPVLNDDA